MKKIENLDSLKIPWFLNQLPKTHQRSKKTMTDIDHSSGCILLFKDDSQRMRIILVNERNKGYYECFGGMIDRNEDSKSAAIRETKEESCLLFNVANQVNLGRCGKIGGNKKHVFFPIVLDTTRSQVQGFTHKFRENRLQMKNHGSAYNETDDLTSFDVEKMISFYTSQSSSTQKLDYISYIDNSGKRFKIGTRPIKCLIQLQKMSNMYSSLKEKPCDMSHHTSSEGCTVFTVVPK